MDKFRGVLRKMKTEHLDKVEYYLDMKTDFINVNQLIGKTIEIQFDGYECLSCSAAKEIFRQGFCKSCFFDQPSAGDWIMKPELSTAHLGIEDRDLEYEKKVQLEPHIVYLANTGKVKVGVTRKTQVPTRWIDQGAHEAIEIVEVPNRYLAGITEVALKEFVADKTNWRTMLKNEIEDADLKEFREELRKHIPEETKQYFLSDKNVTEINFPVEKYPIKIKSLNLKKTEQYKGKLVGVKGQYFIFEDETVFNVRSNEGLVINLNLV